MESVSLGCPLRKQNAGHPCLGRKLPRHFELSKLFYTQTSYIGPFRRIDHVSVPWDGPSRVKPFHIGYAAVHREEGREQGLGPDHTDSSHSILWTEQYKSN